VLPAFNTALDQTLIADLPLCIDPISCIRADAEHVGSIVQALSTSPQNNEIHHAHFLGDTMIYRVSCGSVPVLEDLTNNF
jgi:hypothetical protein